MRSAGSSSGAGPAERDAVVGANTVVVGPSGVGLQAGFHCIGDDAVAEVVVVGADHDRRSARLNRDRMFKVCGQAAGDGHAYCGQNWDWRSAILDTVVMLRIEQPGLPTIVMQVEAGQVDEGGHLGRVDLDVLTADRDERRRPERELLRPEERGDEQVATRLQAAIGPKRHAVAEIVPQQHLVDLGQPELPWRADVLDRRQRGRPGPAGVSGEVDIRGAGLRDAGRDGPDPTRRHELHADPSSRIDGAQVGDELGKVLDRVDVVVRRRADVALPGLAATQGGDVGRRLATRQLTALTRLRPLGDLDLELIGAGEIRGGDAEPCRRDLLDPGVPPPPVGTRGVPRRILATLPGVGGTTRALDADRQRLVRLG